MIKRLNFIRKSLKRARSSQRGVALVIVSLVLLLLSLLVLSAQYTAISQTKSTSSYRYSTQAFYVAEAGIQRTVDWFQNQYNSSVPNWTAASAPLLPLNETTYPNMAANNTEITLVSVGNGSNFPVASMISGTATSFQNYLNAANNLPVSANLQGQYTVTAVLLSTRFTNSLSGPQNIERWRLDSVGQVVGGNNNILAKSENIAVIEKTIQAGNLHGVCANSVDFTGGFTADSYDSSTGSSNTQQTDGDVGGYANSPGPFTANGNVHIYGQLDIPPADQGSNCNYATGGCGTDYCGAVPTAPTYCPSSSSSNNGTATNNGTSNSPKFVAAVGVCSTGGCAPGNIPAGQNAGKVQLSGQNTGQVTLPANTSGDACFWINSFSTSGQVTFKFDNLTNRVGAGKMNIYMNSFSLSGGSSIVINSNSASPINLYIANSFDSSGGTFTNAVTNDLGLFIFYTGTGAAKYSGQAGTGATFIATNGDVTLTGGSTIYGAVIAKGQVTGTGGSTIHFDRALDAAFSTVSNFRQTAGVRRVY